MPETRFTSEQWHQLLEATMASIRSLAKLKGGEYSGDVDKLANFRRLGLDQGLPMETIWRVYAGKHWDAISTYCKDLLEGFARQRSEPISGRVDDLLVYLLLLKAMIQEREEASPPMALLEAPKDTCVGHQWHRMDRFTDVCLLCNSMRGHAGRGRGV